MCPLNPKTVTLVQKSFFLSRFLRAWMQSLVTSICLFFLPSSFGSSSKVSSRQTMCVSASVCSEMAATVIFNLVVVSLIADTNVCGALQCGADFRDFCSQTLETRGCVGEGTVVFVWEAFLGGHVACTCNTPGRGLYLCIIDNFSSYGSWTLIWDYLLCRWTCVPVGSLYLVNDALSGLSTSVYVAYYKSLD